MAMADPIEISAEDLRRIQLLELDILKEIDRIVRKNGLRYTLCGGSLLGTIRHNGFIPWDDDIDVSMVREDYDKFFEACKRDLNHDKYFAQTMDTDPTYQIEFGRILLKNTVFQRSGQEHIKVNNGFFVEIFPRDPLSDNLFIETIQMFLAFIMRKMLYARMGVRVSKNYIYKILYWVLSHNAKKNANYILQFINWLTRGKKTEVMTCWGTMDRWEKDLKKMGMKKLLWKKIMVLFSRNDKKERVVNRPWFYELEERKFEDMTVMITKHWDKWLSGAYGDYMKIPPIDERQRHKTVSYIDFGPYKKQT